MFPQLNRTILFWNIKLYFIFFGCLLQPLGWFDLQSSDRDARKHIYVSMNVVSSVLLTILSNRKEMFFCLAIGSQPKSFVLNHSGQPGMTQIKTVGRGFEPNEIAACHGVISAKQNYWNWIHKYVWRRSSITYLKF